MKNLFVKHLSRIMAILVVGGGIGLFLLTLVFCLPSSTIMKNLQSSIWQFREEGYYPIEIGGYPGTQKDNFTDIVMLSSAMYYNSSKSALDKAIHVYRKSYPSANGDLLKNMQYQVENAMSWEEVSHIEYSRYWHGYLIFLRPLLQFFSYEQLCQLSRLLQFLLTVSIIYLLGKNRKPILLVAFLAYIFTTSPVIVVSSMQFMSVHYITLLAILVLVICKEKEADRRYDLEWYAYFFLLIGMLTSFFDFLTAPILTLGIPLLVAVSLEQHMSTKKLLMQLVVCGTMWSIGYLGLWLMKWVLGSLLSGENLFVQAFNSLMFRTSESFAGTNNLRSLVIDKNMSTLNEPYKMIYVGALLFAICGCIKNKVNAKRLFIDGWPLLLFACTPFAWWLATANHAFIHSWFTYRSISIAIFSILVWADWTRIGPLSEN